VSPTIVRRETTMRKQVELRAIDGNPHRGCGSRACIRDTIDALKADIAEFGFWGVLRVRPKPADAGRYELEAGHHRLQALKELHGDAHVIEVDVADLDDAQMLRALIADNRFEYTGDALTRVQEAGAVVQAFAAGRIDLPPVPARTPKAKLRFAPSYLIAGERPSGPSGPMDKAYTLKTLTSAMGHGSAGGRVKTPPALKESLLTLGAIERGELTEEQLRGLTISEMTNLRRRVQRKRPPAPARHGRGVASAGGCAGRPDGATGPPTHMGTAGRPARPIDAPAEPAAASPEAIVENAIERLNELRAALPSVERMPDPYLDALLSSVEPLLRDLWRAKLNVPERWNVDATLQALTTSGHEFAWITMRGLLEMSLCADSADHTPAFHDHFLRLLQRAWNSALHQLDPRSGEAIQPHE